MANGSIMKFWFLRFVDFDFVGNICFLDIRFVPMICFFNRKLLHMKKLLC